MGKYTNKRYEAVPVIPRPLIEGKEAWYHPYFGRWVFKYDPEQDLWRWAVKKKDGTMPFLTDEFPFPKGHPSYKGGEKIC